MRAFGAPRRAGLRGRRVPSSAQPPRLARRLARAPPLPRDGGRSPPLLRRDDSRGGGALRFGARYGSSDSLPTAPAGRASQPDENGRGETRSRS